MSLPANWVSAPARSSAASYAARDDSELRTERAVCPKGVSRAHDLDDDDFRVIQDAWKVEIRDYDRFWDRFNSWNKRLARRNRITNIEDWRHSSITEQERLYQQMPRSVSVYQRCMYAGNEFRTTKSQGNCKTDNSRYFFGMESSLFCTEMYNFCMLVYIFLL